MKTSPQIFVLLLCLAYVILAISSLATPPWPDAILYDTVARDFIQSGHFRYKIWGGFDPTYIQANFNNGPLYPAIHYIFLHTIGSTDSRLFVVLNFIFLLAATWNVARALKFNTSHYWLLLIVLFNPLVLNYIGIERPEFLNIFLFTCIWRALAIQNPSPQRSLVAGVFLGLAALTHQFAIFFLLPVTYWILVLNQSWRRRITCLLFGVLGGLVATFPYIYYIVINQEAFQFQLFHNQMQESVSTGILSYIRSFLTPLFYPSISVFTLTDQIPRWLLDGLPTAIFFAIGALAIKLRRQTTLSPSTKSALVVWLSMSIGCAVTTYTPYVSVFFSIFVVSLLRDIFPEVSIKLRRILLVAAALGFGHHLVIMQLSHRHLFNWQDFDSSVACLTTQLPNNETVYIMAYPDPSVALINARPDLDIRRYIDFAQYKTAWSSIVQNEHSFIISGDRNFFDRFDHGGALHRAIASGQVTQTECQSGPLHYIYLQKQ